MSGYRYSQEYMETTQFLRKQLSTARLLSCTKCKVIKVLLENVALGQGHLSFVWSQKLEAESREWNANSKDELISMLKKR